MRITESEFSAHVRKHKKVLYLCHRNADPDAIGSGFALQQAFGGALGVVEDMSRSGKALATAIRADPLIDPQVQSYDLIVVVDTSVYIQLGNIELAKYAVVDHHIDEDLLAGAEFYTHRHASSTAEIVWKILLESHAMVSRDIALGLLVGMISDTGRFKRASPEGFRAAAGMLETGRIDYDEALGVLSTPTETSQRMAILKAAS